MKAQHWVLVAVVAFTISATVLGVALVGRPPKASGAEAFAEQRHTLEPLWAAPAFAYTSHTGAAVTSVSLAGAPYLANFVFTSCRTICPLLTAKMVQVQKKLPGARMRFVSFSVDPSTDTPQVLDEYRRKWNATEDRWLLLATDARTLPVTAAGFRITAMKNPRPEEGDPIIHSGVFALVDAAGMVRGIYDSEHREDFEAMIRDAKALTSAPDAPSAPQRSADALYHELSCVTCHENPALAPSLHGLFGRRQELTTSLVVTVDKAYLKESILAPEAKRVAGYPLRMPSYDGLVSTAELDALVDYIAALPGADAAKAAAIAIDPVCAMEVRVTDDAIRSDSDAGVHYFCSEHCKERFERNPAAFLTK